jgi:hypothetical protein
MQPSDLPKESFAFLQSEGKVLVGQHIHVLFDFEALHVK